MNSNNSPKSTAAAPIRMPSRLLPVRFLAMSALALGLSTNLFGDPVEMTFDSVNGAQAFGVYVGPYSGTMDGTPVGLFCVDFANEVQFGERWDANLTPLSTGADLSGTRWGAEPDALAHYQQAAWLSLQFASQPASQYGGIQATMWQLFYSSAPSPGSSDWLDQAQSNYASIDYGDFFVVTNTAPVLETGQVQEFLTELPPSLEFEPFGHTQSNAAPEPETQAMLGLALAGAACVFRRRLARR